MLLAVVLPGTTGWLAIRRFRVPATARLLAMGHFHQVAHKGRGTATIYQMADGSRMLRLDDFSLPAGSGLQVVLVAAPDAYENETVEKAGFVSLGELQMSSARMTWPVPATIDLRKYQAVTIWQRRMRVNFATAPLRPVK